MTSKERVLTIYPYAVCKLEGRDAKKKGKLRGVYVVRRRTEGQVICGGPSGALAWKFAWIKISGSSKSQYSI